MKRFFSTFLIVLGISLLSASSYLTWQRTNTGRLAFTSYQGTKVSSQSDRVPVVLSIADLNIHLPIKQATISYGKWEASHDAISYLISSPVPGEKGNSILYGHNWPNLLGNLPKVKPGQNIEIIFNNGTRSVFTVVFTSVVGPDQTHILNNSQDNRITLYTCTGFLDRKRFVATAVLQENQ